MMMSGDQQQLLITMVNIRDGQIPRKRRAGRPLNQTLSSSVSKPSLFRQLSGGTGTAPHMLDIACKWHKHMAPYTLVTLPGGVTHNRPILSRSDMLGMCLRHFQVTQVHYSSTWHHGKGQKISLNNASLGFSWWEAWGDIVQKPKLRSLNWPKSGLDFGLSTDLCLSLLYCINIHLNGFTYTAE